MRDTLSSMRSQPIRTRRPLGARSRAFVRYALKLTRTPHAIVESDLAPLRAVGLSDRGLHDLVAVVAYFNFVNRMASGLGVALEATR